MTEGGDAATTTTSLSSPTPIGDPGLFAFSCVHEENGHWILAFARMTEGKGKDDRRRRCGHYNYLSVIPDPDRGSRVFAFSCVHEENGHWILAFARMTEGKGTRMIRRDRSGACFFRAFHEENGVHKWILAFARMTEGKGKDDRRRRCGRYNYLSVIPDSDRGSRVFAFSCVHEENGHWILAFARMTEGKGKDDRRRRCGPTNTFEMQPLHILYFVPAPSHGACPYLPFVRGGQVG